jgi:hypothetical protein
LAQRVPYDDTQQEGRTQTSIDWFVGLGIDDPVWDPSTLSKNRDRLIEVEVAQGFFDQVLAQAAAKDLLSDEHFSVDGTLLEAWASHKSSQRKDGGSPPPSPGRNGEADFKGERRSNATHQSTTDPEALSHRKSDNQPAWLGYLGHVLMENRNGLVVDTRLTQATGTVVGLLQVQFGLHSRNDRGRPVLPRDLKLRALEAQRLDRVHRGTATRRADEDPDYLAPGRQTHPLLGPQGPGGLVALHDGQALASHPNRRLPDGIVAPAADLES